MRLLQLPLQSQWSVMLQPSFLLKIMDKRGTQRFIYASVTCILKLNFRVAMVKLELAIRESSCKGSFIAKYKLYLITFTITAETGVTVTEVLMPSRKQPNR